MDIFRFVRWIGFFCVVALLAASIVGIPIAALLMVWAMAAWNKGLKIEQEHPDIQPEDWLFAPVQTATRVVEKDEERKRLERAEWRRQCNQPDHDPFGDED